MQTNDEKLRCNLKGAKVELLSRIGKVFLQIGNVDEARRFFSRAEIIAGEYT